MTTLFFLISFCLCYSSIQHSLLVVLPPWPSTYDMSESTIIQPCNVDGWFNSSFAAKFGITSYDWSNAKKLWSKVKPMNCEEDLVTQAEETKSINPDARVWVYRNLVKALPWFSSVRAKLEDPAYWGWFLHYKNASGNTATTNLYHDFEQTPSGDCGVGVECGEYLFDHRNASLLNWLIHEYTVSPTGVLNPNIDGLFIDDHWSASGPSEEDGRCIEIIGLSTKDVTEITQGWQANTDAVHTAMIKANAFAWQLLSFTDGSDQVNPRAQCAEWIRENCKANSSISQGPLMFGFTRVASRQPFPLPAFEQDLATFLLVRGPYAWLGYDWVGCSKPWERPAGMDIDYGVPTSDCKETQTGVFVREYSKATVTMDCTSWTANIKMK